MTDQAIPIRKFTYAEALAWLRAKPDDPLSASALARAWGWPRIRVRRRLIAWKASGLVGRPDQGQAGRMAGPLADQAGHAGHLAGQLLGGAVALVGIGLSLVGLIATVTYGRESGGGLMAVFAGAADVTTLAAPPAASAMWQARRWPLALAAWSIWLAASTITAGNLAGYVGLMSADFVDTRELQQTEHDVVLDRLARLRSERTAITETRPPSAINAAINAAGSKAEVDKLRSALAMAKRRDQVDRDLLDLESKLPSIPKTTTADPSAAVLVGMVRQLTGARVTEAEMRRLRLELLMTLPLLGGIVLSIGLAVAAPGRRP